MVNIELLANRQGFEENYHLVLFECDDYGVTNLEILEILDVILTSSLKQSQKGKLVNLLSPNELIDMRVLVKIISCLNMMKLGDGIRKKIANWIMNNIISIDYSDSIDKLIPWVWNLLKMGTIRGQIVSVLVYWINRVENINELMFCTYRLDMIREIYKVDQRIGPLIWTLRHLFSDELKVKRVLKGIENRIIERQGRFFSDNDRYSINLKVYHSMNGTNKWNGLNQYVKSLVGSNMNVLKYITGLKFDFKEYQQQQDWEPIMLDLLDLVLIVDQLELDYIFNVLLGYEKGVVVFKGFMTEFLAKLGLCCQVGHRLPEVIIGIVNEEINISKGGEIVNRLDIKTLREMSAHEWIEYLPFKTTQSSSLVDVIAKTQDGDMVLAVIRMAIRWLEQDSAAAEKIYNKLEGSLDPIRFELPLEKLKMLIRLRKES